MGLLFLLCFLYAGRKLFAKSLKLFTEKVKSVSLRKANKLICFWFVYTLHKNKAFKGGDAGAGGFNTPAPAKHLKIIF